MTSMLPPTRDLPPGRHTRIRAEIERAAAGRRSRLRRFAPLVAAGAAVGAVAAGVVFLAPPPQAPTASPPGSTTTVPTSEPAAPTSRPEPVIPGLSAERIAAIEKGCQQSAGVQGTPKLYQHVRDEAGSFALIYTGSAVMTCTLDTAAFPFNSGMNSGFDPEWLPGHFSLDTNEASAGGDLPGNKPIYHGQHGYRLVVGRVDSKVARVTFTQDGQTIDARIANNTYVARMVHPTTWSPPPGIDGGEVRAYDAAGNLLGSSNGPDKCFVNPQGVIVFGGWQNPNVDPKTCEPARPWR